MCTLLTVCALLTVCTLLTMCTLLTRFKLNNPQNFYSSLPYIEALLLESMRVSSLAPIALIHQATQDTVIDGYLIPKVCTRVIGGYLIPKV